MSKANAKDSKSAKSMGGQVQKTSKKKRGMSKPLYNQKFKTPMKKKRKNEYDPEEESRLEKIVFGDPSDIINTLPDDDDEIFSTKSKNVVTRDDTVLSDSANDHLDSQESEDVRVQRGKRAAWTDEDDAQYSVEDAVKAQNRSFPERKPEKLYTELLQNKYKQLVGTPKWAELTKTDEESDDIDKDILKHSCHVEKPKQKNLPKSVIEIKALTSINKQTHTEGPIVSSLEFHPSSTVALVAGSSGTLSLFQIDGIQNNKLHSMLYKKFPISTAKFLKDGTEVVIGSQFYPHCHSYNLMTGNTYRVPLPHGITNMKRCEVSPDGKLLAVCGRLGEIYLLTSSTKELVATLKMNGACRTVAFTPDSKTLVTHGDGNEMYIWDVNSRSCIHRAIDDGCLSCSSIAMSPSGQFLATGSKEGVVNLYDTKTVMQNRVPIPLKIVLNLVTSITALKFNPLSEILAMSSNKKNNAFKMLHLPSFNVFSNFPTFQTNINAPETINFSPGSGYLGISNRSGTAFLYRLKHYGNY